MSNNLIASGTPLYKVFRTNGRGANAAEGSSVLATQNPMVYKLASGTELTPQIAGTPVMVFLTKDDAEAFGLKHRPNGDYIVKKVLVWGDVVPTSKVLHLGQGGLWRNDAPGFWKAVKDGGWTGGYKTEEASRGTAGVFGICRIA